MSLKISKPAAFSWNATTTNEAEWTSLHQIALS